jgi:4-aminobutyrate aminotransferase / (S)-3-amino-2-methylpropionate transaminase / 5-aminovalerate transaminase
VLTTIHVASRTATPLRSCGSVGIELVTNRATREPARHETNEIIRLASERGVILIAAGTFGNVVRFLAPLTITDDEVDEGLEALSGCFVAVAADAAVR